MVKVNNSIANKARELRSKLMYSDIGAQEFISLLKNTPQKVIDTPANPLEIIDDIAENRSALLEDLIALSETKKDCEEIIEYILSKTPKLNFSEYLERTPLSTAILYNKEELIGKLINMGADINPKNVGFPPLVCAIITGNKKLVQFFLSKKVDVNGGIASKPLSAAISSGDFELVKILVSMGAKLNETNIKYDPIYQAIISNQIEILKYLVEEGANPAKKILSNRYIVDSINLQHLDITSFLLSQKGMDIKSKSTPMPIADKNEKYTPMEMILKIETNNIIVSKLVQLGSDIPQGYVYDKENNIVLKKEYSKQNSKNIIKAVTIFGNKKPVIVEKKDTYTKKIINLLNSKKLNAKEFVKEFYKYIKTYDSNNVKDEKQEDIQEFVTKNQKKLFETINASGLKFKPLRDSMIKKAIKYHVKFDAKNVKYKFILTTQDSFNESKMPGNDEKAKEYCATFFKDGKIYNTKSGKLIGDSESTLLYVMSKTGKLYIHTREFIKLGVHHSYILKGKQGSEIEGYGKPVASAGMLKVKNGKITFIDNSSGHYQPNKDQLKIAAKFLKSQGVFSDYGFLQLYEDKKGACFSSNMNFSDLDKVVVGDILDQYAEVAY